MGNYSCRRWVVYIVVSQKAEKYSKESLDVSIKCKCSSNNTSRAKVTMAMVQYEKYLKDPKSVDHLEDTIEDALNSALANKNRKYIAEAKILLSKTMKNRNPQARIDIVDEALELYKDIGSENISTALLEKSILLFENNELEVAEILLEEGIENAKERNQIISKAYLVSQKAALAQSRGKTLLAIKVLIKNLKEQKSLKLYPLLYQNKLKLMEIFMDEGFFKLALKIGYKALALNLKIRNRETNKEILSSLIEDELTLKTDISNIKLNLADEYLHAP